MAIGQGYVFGGKLRIMIIKGISFLKRMYIRSYPISLGFFISICFIAIYNFNPVYLFKINLQYPENFSILLGAFLVSWLGFETYKMQKSVEECREKYLNQGLNALYDEFSKLYANYQLNYEEVKDLLRYVRSYDRSKQPSIKKEDLLISLSGYFPKDFAFPIMNRTQQLLKNDILTRAFLSFLVNVRMATMTYQREIRLYIEMYFDGQMDNNTRDEQLKDMNDLIAKHDVKVRESFKLFDEIGNLTHVMNYKQISYDTIDEIGEDKKIIEILDAIQNKYSIMQNQSN